MDIAIIGMAGRFPEAVNLRAFLRNLTEGKDSVREIGRERQLATGLAPADNYQLLGYLDDVDRFDPAFFGISRSEAKNMAPQQRLFLEVALETIENAGYHYEAFSGSNTAVFVGDTQLQYYALARLVEPTLYTGNMSSIMASRVARFFNLRGKALMVDTTCSSTLVALHLACNELAAGECDQALVGGVSLNLFPNKKTTVDHLGVLSGSGKARTFSARADGTSAGEAAACLLLKPLAKALADHDVIHAVIKGSAVNQDANLSGSLTAPSSTAQAEVICQAWQRAGIDPTTVGFIEAHGTGTKLGDPIEIEGITMAYRKFTDQKAFCAVSAVKSNIGHTDCVAGLAGLIKAVLSLQERKLFPSLHFDAPNPFIDFANAPVYVNDTLRDWLPPPGGRLRAGVSSFGLTGTNCHVVLEEAPPRRSPADAPAPGAHLAVVSGRTPAALRANAQALLAHLDHEPGLSLRDVSYTLLAGRKAFDCRWAGVVASVAELKEALREVAGSADPPSAGQGEPKIICVFSDGAAIDPALPEAFAAHPVFRGHYQACAAANGAGETPAFRQFAFQYSLYKCLEAWGLQKATLVGDTLGKIVIDALTGKRPLPAAVDAAARYVPEAKPDFERRCRALLDKCKDEPVLFLEAGPLGSITRTLRDWQAPESRYRVLPVRPGGPDALPGYLRDLYLENVALDWERVLADWGGKRVALPAYQFDRERCWLEEDYPFEKVAGWFHQLQWVPDPAPGAASPVSGQTFLVVAGPGSELAGAVRERLAAGRNTCIRLDLSTGFERLGDHHFRVSANNAPDYARVDQCLTESGVRLDGILCLAGEGAGPQVPADPEAALTPVYGQFHLYQAFRQRLSRKGFRLVVVTAGAHPVPGPAPTDPRPAMHAAMLRGLQAEYPMLLVKGIDLEGPDDPAAAERVCEEIGREDNVRYCAYREGVRYLPKLGSLRPDRFDGDITPLLQEHGVYLVTGGADGIGLEVCKSIARRQPGYFIILGRTRLPFRARWADAVRVAGEEPGIVRRIEGLLALEQLGVQCEYHAVDVADAARMEAFFAGIKGRFARINGVIHAAGLPIENVPFAENTFDGFRNTLRAKVTGTVLLDEHVRELKPDFFILFSSLNALVPKKYSTAYTVANAFLDAFAAAQRARGKANYVAIGWPGWRREAAETAAGADEPAQGLRPIGPKEGIAAFYYALKVNEPAVAVGEVDLSRFLNNPFFAVEGTAAPRPEGPAPRAEVTLTATEATLLNIWREVLMSDAIGPEDDFFEIGGHSLIGIQVVNRIEKELGVAIDFEVFFDYYTVKTLSGYVDGLLSAGTTHAYEAIAPIEEQEHYEVSHAQQRLWVIDQLVEGPVYNIPTTYELHGDLDAGALMRAFDALVARHESLRTVLLAVDGQPRQKVLEPGATGPGVKYVDLADSPLRYQQADALVKQAVSIRFDLQQGPGLFAQLVRVEPGRHLFSFTLHHIISDGWSSGIILREIVALYNAFRRQLPSPLTPLRVQYKDFTQWQRRQLQRGAYAEHRTYWLEQFRHEVPVLNLPTDFPRQSEQTFTGQFLNVTFEKSLVDAIRAGSHRQDATVFMTLFTAVNLLLHRYTGQTELVIGTPVTERGHYDLEDQIGFYVNTLPLKTAVSGTDTFAGLLEKVKKVITDANKHKGYPLEQLVDELDLVRDTSRSPLFDVLAIYQNVSAAPDELRMEGIQVEGYPHAMDISKFDLTFDFYESESDIVLKLIFNPSLFTAGRIERMAAHLRQILAAGLQDGRQEAGALPLLEPEEQQTLLLGGNGPLDTRPRESTFQALFEESVARHGARPALYFAGRTLTYDELNEKANRLAHYLRHQHQVAPDELVAVLMKRSDDLVVALLGVLKSGAAYLPIDPAYPPERIGYVLADAGAKVLLTDTPDLVPALPPSVALAEAGEVGADLSRYLAHNPAPVSTAENLAYVIYTSGSTGQPKGVGVEDGNLVNYLLWANAHYFNDGAGHCFGFFTSIAFDLTITAVFTTLLRGDKLYIYPDEPVADILAHAFGPGSEVNAVKVTPSHLRLLHQLPLRSSNVRTVVVGGEALHSGEVSPLWTLNPDVRVVDEYGPSETTVGCTAKELTPAGEGG
ncbi:MAG: SDR family NAD(P)-dependent oxidoreductase, partial [Cytophagales bacterium]|nr:SDR family NAD(P)-dependent oxidoreductase [Cytophagales bacterium]